jgi:uncharacterized protein (TIGR02145 family)
MNRIISFFVFYVLSNCYAQNAAFYYSDKENKEQSVLIISSQNLQVTSFRNGDIIKEAKTKEEWLKAAENEEPAWCYYDNDPRNGKNYGVIYNYYALKDSRGLCANGWSKVYDTDVYKLEEIIKKGGDSAKLAIKSRTGWGNLQQGTNSSGLNLIPGGYRDEEGNFVGMGNVALFWRNSDKNLYCPFWGIKNEQSSLFNDHGFFIGLTYHPGYDHYHTAEGNKILCRVCKAQAFFDQNVKKMGFYLRTVCDDCDYDEDGVEDHIDKCLNLAGTAGGKGCPDTDGDGVYDNIDRCPDVRGEDICRGCPKKFTEEMLSVEGVSFNKNSAEMTIGQTIKLQHLVLLLKTDICLEIFIQGSSDYEGPIWKNENKSKDDASNIVTKYAMGDIWSSARAIKVRDYLIHEGVSKSRITIFTLMDYRLFKDKKSWKTKKDCVEFKLFY